MSDAPDGEVEQSNAGRGWLGRQREGTSSFAFILQTRDRRIKLEADSEAHAFSWVEMLNAAHRIGRGDHAGFAESVQEEPDTPVEVGSPWPSSPSRSVRSEAASTGAPTSPSPEPTEASTEAASRAASPTDANSITSAVSAAESQSTAEGSIFTVDTTSSPAAWSEVEEAASEAVPASSSSASPAPTPQVATQAFEDEELEADACSFPVDVHYRVPASRSAALSPRKATWQTAAEAAKADDAANLSASGRLNLQVADFGFDDRDEISQGSASRSSSPESVTISPRFREETPAVHRKTQSASSLPPRVEADNGSRSDEDDDSDFELLCEVRNDRIAKDLDLMQMQNAKFSRPRAASPCMAREIATKDATGDIRLQAEQEAGDEENAARIAADLKLLEISRGACSSSSKRRVKLDEEADSRVDDQEERVARRAARRATKVAAAAQQQELAETEEQEKARRRAARKAAKEEAHATGSQEQRPAQDAESHQCSSDAAVAEEEAKARRKAERRAARDATAAQMCFDDYCRSRDATAARRAEHLSLEEEKARQKAAKRAAKELTLKLKETQEVPRQTAKCAGVAQGSWVEGLDTVKRIGGS